MAQISDPYRALGVARSATDSEIKAAHRALAKRYHPDAEDGDTGRFLSVQEAYRVLSDPLLRREWDARHAPGPVRADRQAGPVRADRQPGAGRADRQPRPPAPSRKRPAAAPSEAAAATDQPPSARPRSSRAYTWSAGDVPWWEEGTAREAKRRRRPPADQAQPPRDNAPNEFDVYNRSSGAAWSMAARAYFRRGEQDLPRRGSFHRQGTQPLTAARARVAAEEEARRRAAAQGRSATSQPRAPATPRTRSAPPRAPAPPRPPAPPRAAAAPGSAAAPRATTSSAMPGAAAPGANEGVARDARRIQWARELVRRRASAERWPSLRDRLLYSFLAWVPLALLIGYGGALATGCGGPGAVGCPPQFETMQSIAMAIALGLLVALPRVAYIGAMGTIGALLAGLGLVGIMAAAGLRPPLPTTIVALFAAALLAAYAGSALFVLLRDASHRPWSNQPRRVDARR